MGKTGAKFIAKIHKPDHMPALSIVDQSIGIDGTPDGCAATIVGNPHSPRITRAELVSLRDQIDQWLEAHE